MYLIVLLIVASAVFYYRVGQHEYGRGFMWASISILMAVVTMSVLNVGTTGFLVGQAVLFAAMTGYNMRRESEKQAKAKGDGK